MSISRQDRYIFCPRCGTTVYPADTLKLWMETDGLRSIETVTTRVMMTLEHLLMVHNVRHLHRVSPQDIGKTAFIVDGPLAVFGWGCQWLHAPIMEFLHRTTLDLEARGLQRPVVFGLQKQGYVVDHARVLERLLPANRFFPVDDAYRYTYMRQGPDVTRSRYGFGSESYYGQDFLFKSPTGKMYVVGVPYPFFSKESAGNFPTAKLSLQRYKTIGSVLSLINYFECDLYENSVVPMVLAHSYTSISAGAGGNVLHELVDTALTPIR